MRHHVDFPLSSTQSVVLCSSPAGLARGALWRSCPHMALLPLTRIGQVREAEQGSARAGAIQAQWKEAFGLFGSVI